MGRTATQERLQKVLAQAGIASRRACEQLIVEGRVRVNGKIVTELGTKVDAHHDKIEVNGRKVVAQKPAYYVVHKPRAMMTTMKDPEGRPTIADILKRIPERVVPVGRLDFHTSGALLVTNDGVMAEALMRPSAHVPKVYAAKLQGHLEVAALSALRNGVLLDDGYRTKPADVVVLRQEDRTTWVQITLREGKNRQIHRMGEALGHRVMRLARLSVAGIDAEKLRPGTFRELTGPEIDDLKKKYLNPYKRTRATAAVEATKERNKAFEYEFEDG